ncbi:hypothetical protein B0T26DRAFT_729058 [Lasiosphaeria miniovina]|uniref:Uncharacterized protein n=1 Tax=Lasiosphaeria miniovina TaxID=1954250 RepID=A0AA40A0T5_9PEZI|nr:uncharacterized protein B0T26DRAFT_729058 [Lasiosphaeria miniovina]KAK0707070.1 hypothetical protein B0T26DRAFT_729058 [Lasiosphaeria miniovina]
MRLRAGQTAGEFRARLRPRKSNTTPAFRAPASSQALNSVRKISWAQPAQAVPPFLIPIRRGPSNQSR